MKNINIIERHKWVKDDNGKRCNKCGSRVNSSLGKARYIEVDGYGIAEPVNWYPRCQYIKTIKKIN